MLKVLKNEDFSTVLKSQIPVFIDFGSSGCSICTTIYPQIEELSRELEGKVDFYYVNVDEDMTLADRLNVLSVPTLMVVKNGRIVFREAGARDKESIRSLLGL